MVQKYALPLPVNTSGINDVLTPERGIHLWRYSMLNNIKILIEELMNL